MTFRAIVNLMAAIVLLVGSMAVQPVMGCTMEAGQSNQCCDHCDATAPGRSGCSAGCQGFAVLNAFNAPSLTASRPVDYGSGDFGLRGVELAPGVPPPRLYG